MLADSQFDLNSIWRPGDIFDLFHLFVCLSPLDTGRVENFLFIRFRYRDGFNIHDGLKGKHLKWLNSSYLRFNSPILIPLLIFREMQVTQYFGAAGECICSAFVTHTHCCQRYRFRILWTKALVRNRFNYKLISFNALKPLSEIWKTAEQVRFSFHIHIPASPCCARNSFRHFTQFPFKTISKKQFPMCFFETHFPLDRTPNVFCNFPISTFCHSIAVTFSVKVIFLLIFGWYLQKHYHHRRQMPNKMFEILLLICEYI